MTDFGLGILASVVAAIVVAIASLTWKWLKNRFFYKGVRVNGTWDVFEDRDGKRVNSGKLKLQQSGSFVKGTSTRTKTRGGKKSNREFKYHGSVSGHQMTLIFEDKKGDGFDTGSYVFIIQNDCTTMIGRTTFHGKPENEIVSERRTLVKVIS